MNSKYKHARTNLYENYKLPDGEDVALHLSGWYEMYRDAFCNVLESDDFKTDDNYSKLLTQMDQSPFVGDFLYDEQKQLPEIAAYGLVVMCRLNESIPARVNKGTDDGFFWQHEELFECYTYVAEAGARQSLARQMARKRHEKSIPAKNFVRSEWLKNAEKYGGNKSAFARDYARRVLNEYGEKVTEKQLKEVWLKSTSRPEA